MQELTRDDLFSLEKYSSKRQDYRANVFEHKKNRQVALGDHATLYFEDRMTIQYQIQEMLRIEKIFEAAGINEELAAYNPLIPNGQNLKATFMIEYSDAEERQRVLETLGGVEDKVWVQVEGFDKVYAVADEDMDRNRDEKTSAVHFMRFEFSDEMIAALKSDKTLSMGIDYDGFMQNVSPIKNNAQQALINDFD
ncbi:Hypothetical protein i Rubrerythrin cluster [hydrothermal vent metagenome]|uniref:DUF3501 domain-containing protein n=1 Tax=hydrothermal vent metagenome TaxID=652676 RepID=A0A3B0ZTC7_9ZZZZ